MPVSSSANDHLEGVQYSFSMGTYEKCIDKRNMMFYGYDG
jgi:hypothetical protein